MGFVAEESPSSLRHSVLHLWASIMDRSVTQACRAALSGDENVRKCCLSVPRYTLERQKGAELLLKRAVLHPQATESVGFVAEESHSSLRHSVLHLWASIMDRSVTQACRAALSGDENVRKCCLSVPRYTLGRQRSAEVSLKRAALHPRATKRRGIVAQACRAAPPGDGKCGFRCRRVPFILTSFCLAPFGNENGLKCRLKVSYCTLGRRKCTKVLPKRAALHPRATKMLGSVTQACRTLLSGDEKYGFRCRRVPFILASFCLAPLGNKNGLKCRLKVSYCTLGRRKWAEVSLKRAVLHSRATILG